MKKVFLERRKILTQMGYLGAGTLLSARLLQLQDSIFFRSILSRRSLRVVIGKFKPASKGSETLTPEGKVTSHNNFYEFGTQKHQPAGAVLVLQKQSLGV